MRKTIQICGYEVEVASNAASLLLYKKEFHRDPMRDLMLIAKGVGGKSDVDAIADNNEFSLDVFMNFLYIFAKTAKADMPPMYEWLAQFDVPALDFIMEAIPQIQDLISSNMKTTVKSRKK